MTSRALNNAIKLSGLASTDTYAFSSVTTDTLSSSKAISAFLSGNFTITNTQSKAGFIAYTYYGNNTYPRSFTVGVDLDTQWGDNTSEKYGGLVWVKNRDAAFSHVLYDTVRGTGTSKSLYTNSTEIEGYLSGNANLTSFDSNGFTVGSTTSTNILNDLTQWKHVSWIFQTTHRVSGTTNHGKAYTSHYNPYTGFTIIKYTGSGVDGHEIPHHLGRHPGFVVLKRLDSIDDWWAYYTENDLYYGRFSESFELYTNGTNSHKVLDSEDYITIVAGGSNNTLNATYILYCWENSYYDDAGELNGNYEIGVYQGTGAQGNKITTRGKPAWLMVKPINATGSWLIFDNQRNNLDNYLKADTYDAETLTDNFDLLEDGFNIKLTSGSINGNGTQYLYMVVYDNDSASGKSNYTKSLETSALQVTNGVVSYSHGVNTTGAVNSIENIGTSTLSNISWDI